MALIKCPECGREVSNTADLCPNCGYPVKAPKKLVPVKRIGIVMVIAIVILVCITVIFFANKLSDVEQAEVDSVFVAITDIGEVGHGSDWEIVRAEELYNKLSKKCQRHVKNRKEMMDARDTYNNLKAEETVNLINEIGTVTLDNQEAVDEAQKFYKLLSDEQKELVNNAEDLQTAQKQLSTLRIDDVNSKISAIGTVALDSGKKIKEARKSYDALSDDDKSKIKKYKDLTNAETEYEDLAVNSCISLIDSIGTVTLESKEKIEEAKKLYNSLSKDSKDKVANYEILTSADHEYTELVKAEEDRKITLNPGDSFSTSKWEVTYTKTNINAKILPNSTSGYYSYYYANDDETFIDIVLQIKNIDTDILGIEDIIGTCEVEYDNSKLSKSYALYTSSGSRIERVYNWDGLDAISSTTLHVAIGMPREIQTNDKSLTVKLIIAGEEKIINVR